MSRATLAVDMCRMMAALCRRRMPPNSVFLATTRTCSRRLSGNSGTPAKNRALARLLEKHWIGGAPGHPAGVEADDVEPGPDARRVSAGRDAADAGHPGKARATGVGRQRADPVGLTGGGQPDQRQ